MNNEQIAEHVKEFQDIRGELIDRLVRNPAHRRAAHDIISINAKIELLISFWNWSDTSVDFPR